MEEIKRKGNGIPDYVGERIPGSRRDEYEARLYRLARQGHPTREALHNILATITEKEAGELRVTRDTVWPLPNAVAEVEGGKPPYIVYWLREIRKLTFPRALILFSWENYKDAVAAYIQQMCDYREHAEAVKTEADMDAFYEYAATADLSRCARKSDIQRTRWHLGSMRYKCQKSGFPYTKRNTSRNRKRNFTPPQLKNVKRDGPDYRMGWHVSPESLLQVFGFRGLEYGTWENSDDRQYATDYAYDALKDLAAILGIQDEDISFSHQLALAFGSRGRSRACAHYEPGLKVINLTKLRGAGSLAHEWLHALDNFLAVHFGITDNAFASESLQMEKLPESFVDLIHAMKRRPGGGQTAFLSGSKMFDKAFSRSGAGYWSSNCELMARAFACYVKDRAGFTSDYLFAHADVYTVSVDDGYICAIPQGEEREMLNKAFDRLFSDLQCIGFFSVRDEAESTMDIQDPALGLDLGRTMTNGQQMKFYWAKDGQMMFG